MYTIPPPYSWPLAGVPLRRIVVGLVAAALLAAPHAYAQTPITIGGVVYEDVDGNSQLNDGVGRPNVNMRVYADTNNDSVLNTGDTHIADAVTGADGRYSVPVTPATTGNRYFVAVDSRSVTPSAGFNAGSGIGDVWAEQTYGDDWRTATLNPGSRFGGRDDELIQANASNRSDRYPTSPTISSNLVYRHLAFVDVTNGSITNLDWGFSFNVVTNTRSGALSSSSDNDTKAPRTVQGSLRQFMQNANAVGGPNIMRFVPTITVSTGNVWRVDVTVPLPELTDSDTTLDGTAYSAADGSTVRDQNPGQLGAGGAVGVNQLPLDQVEKPEFEIKGVRSGTTVVEVGLDVQGSNNVLRHLAVYGFGSTPNSPTSANVRVGGNADNVTIEDNIIGTLASNFTIPDAARSGGDNIRLSGYGTLQRNLIGFAIGNGVAISDDTSSWFIYGNEIQRNGGSGARVTPDTIIVASLISNNDDTGVTASGGVLEQNTVQNNGRSATAESDAGVRLDGLYSLVQQNIIAANHGAGVLVQAAANRNTISQNTITANGTSTNAAGGGPTGQIGIDLLQSTDDQQRGTAPFVTRNDAGDTDSGGNDLQNFPMIERARISGDMLTITGSAAPAAQIELFVAAPDESGFGEAETYLLTLNEGSADDMDLSSGRYNFTFPLPAGVGQGTKLTATATVAESTSEFSGNVTVGDQPTAITLLDFVATPQQQRVVLQWTTATERDTSGYYLLRSSDGTRTSAVPVSPLVPAHTLSMGDKHYTWTDEHVAPGTYTYWLQEVETGGTTIEYGPAVVHVGARHAFVPIAR